MTWSRLGPKHRLAAWVHLLALTAAQPERAWHARCIGRGPGGRQDGRRPLGSGPWAPTRRPGPPAPNDCCRVWSISTTGVCASRCPCRATARRRGRKPNGAEGTPRRPPEPNGRPPIGTFRARTKTRSISSFIGELARGTTSRGAGLVPRRTATTGMGASPAAWDAWPGACGTGCSTTRIDGERRRDERRHSAVRSDRSPPPGPHRAGSQRGHGKTFTIAGLATRYVAEGTPLHQLLVVTFTRAATGELRERVRQRLVHTDDS